MDSQTLFDPKPDFPGLINRSFVIGGGKRGRGCAPAEQNVVLLTARLRTASSQFLNAGLKRKCSCLVVEVLVVVFCGAQPETNSF